MSPPVLPLFSDISRLLNTSPSAEGPTGGNVGGYVRRYVSEVGSEADAASVTPGFARAAEGESGAPSGPISPDDTPSGSEPGRPD